MLAVWAVILLALAILGFLDALYFVLVDAGRLRPDARLVPPVCRMDEKTCARVLDTGYARVFGVSNAALGLVWYGIVAAAAGFAVVEGRMPFCLFLAVAAGVTVLVSVYLLWALVARLRTACPLCFAGHAINALIFSAFVGACVLS